MSEIHDCIGAFADGEPVDPELLDQALTAPDGRAYLIDLLVLRGLYGRRGPAIESTPAAPANTAVQPPVTRRRFFSAAAALIVAGTLGGYVAGRMSAPVPVADRQSVALQPAPGTALTAPTPTQVIKLEPGVDWNERGGGD